MLKLREVKKALIDVLKMRFTNPVYFDNVEKAKESYFYIEMAPSRKTVDSAIYERSIDIDIDIQYVAIPDKAIRRNRTEILDVIDELDEIIRPVIRVKDRAITVSDIRCTIFDEILHYRFEMNFADAFEDQETGELIEELNLVITKE